MPCDNAHIELIFATGILTRVSQAMQRYKEDADNFMHKYPAGAAS